MRATLAPVRDSRGRPLYLFLQVQDVTAERAAPRSCARARSGSGCWSRPSRTTRSSCSTRPGTSSAGTAGAQRSKGYTADEIIGQHFRVFYPPEEQERQHPEHELEVALRDGHYEEEGWRIRKDGSRFWANVLITAVFNDGRRAHRVRQGHPRHHRSAGGWSRSASSAVQALAAANAELESLNRRLQQAADDQSQFLAVTAHELRTPIGVLGGSADTALPALGPS